MPRRALWPDKGKLLQFPLGQNTKDAVNEVPVGALVLAQNADLSERGAVGKTTATAWANDGDPLGTTNRQGLYELVLVDDTRILLGFADGKLYKRNDSTGAWTQIPIRRYEPYGHTATEQASGSVGPNLAASTKYEYRFVAVDAAGKTDTSAGVEITTDSTPNPIDVVAKGVYGATSYEIWRRTWNGASWDAWGRLATGLTHSTAGGKTTVSYTDDGNTAPDTGQTFPASNTTEHTIHTSNKVDAVIELWTGQNALYFLNGDGLCRTDGTSAELVKPYNPTTSEESSVGINALGDVTWGGHSCTNIALHHRYGFICGYQPEPRLLYHSRVADLAWWPSNSYIRVPDPRGGKVLDFITKDDALVVGLSTSVWALFGRVFQPNQADNDYTQVYFGEIEGIGLASGWSLVKLENGWVSWLAADKRVRSLVNVSPVKEQNVVLDVGEAIQPTLDTLTDHDDAFGLWQDGQYWLLFPGDSQVIRFYVTRRGQGYLFAPAVDDSAALKWVLRRKNGDLLALPASGGQVVKLGGNATDRAGTAITWKIRTPQLDCGMREQKKFRKVWVVFKASSRTVVSYEVQVEDRKVTGTLTTESDGTYGQAVYGQSVYGNVQAAKYPISVSLKGDWIQVTLQNAEADRVPLLYGLFIEFTPRRRVK